jgi:hypothetical protein
VSKREKSEMTQILMCENLLAKSRNEESHHVTQATTGLPSSSNKAEFFFHACFVKQRIQIAALKLRCLPEAIGPSPHQPDSMTHVALATMLDQSLNNSDGRILADADARLTRQSSHRALLTL